MESEHFRLFPTFFTFRETWRREQKFWWPLIGVVNFITQIEKLETMFSIRSDLAKHHILFLILMNILQCYLHPWPWWKLFFLQTSVLHCAPHQISNCLHHPALSRALLNLCSSALATASLCTTRSHYFSCAPAPYFSSAPAPTLLYTLRSRTLWTAVHRRLVTEYKLTLRFPSPFWLAL